MRTTKDLTAQEFYDLKKSVMAPVYDDHGVSAPAGVDLSDNWMAPKGAMPTFSPELAIVDPKDQTPDTIFQDLQNMLDEAIYENNECPEWFMGAPLRVSVGHASIVGVMVYFLTTKVKESSDVKVTPDFGPEVVTLSASYYDRALIATFRLDGGASLELVEGLPRVVVQKFEVGL